MKAKISSLLLLAATPAFAHTDAIPHLHAGNQVSILPAVAALTAATLLGYAIVRTRSAHNAKKAKRLSK